MQSEVIAELELLLLSTCLLVCSSGSDEASKIKIKLLDSARLKDDVAVL